MPVRVRVPAKVNLHLAVGPLRPDGYHELVTVLHAVDLYDEVVAAPAEGIELAVTGDGAAYLPTSTIWPGGRRRYWRRGRAYRRTSGCRSSRRSPWRAAWRAAQPTPPRRSSPATHCGEPDCRVRRCASWQRSWAATCRSRCSEVPRSVPAGASDSRA